MKEYVTKKVNKKRNSKRQERRERGRCKTKYIFNCKLKDYRTFKKTTIHCLREIHFRYVSLVSNRDIEIKRTEEDIPCTIQNNTGVVWVLGMQDLSAS